MNTAALQTDLVLAASIVITAFSILYACSKRAGLSRSRTKDYLTAHELLIIHQAALERFVLNASAPENLKISLLKFSEAITDRSALSAAMIASIQNRNISDEAKNLTKQLTKLRSDRPDLSDIFSDAVNSGFQAALFKWPDLADHLSKILAEQMREREVFVQTAQAKIKPDRAVSQFGSPIPA